MLTQRPSGSPVCFSVGFHPHAIYLLSLYVLNACVNLLLDLLPGIMYFLFQIRTRTWLIEVIRHHILEVFKILVVPSPTVWR